MASTPFPYTCQKCRVCVLLYHSQYRPPYYVNKWHSLPNQCYGKLEAVSGAEHAAWLIGGLQALLDLLGPGWRTP